MDIMVISPTTQSILANGIVPLDLIARRKGRCVQSNNNSITLLSPGYYLVNASMTITAPAAGIATLVVQKNGVAVPGLTASETITTADTEERTLNVSGLIKVYCNENANITLNNTGVAVTSSNVSFSISEV